MTESVSDYSEVAVKDITDRLRTIKGHLNGIEKMLGEGRQCEDVLLQLVAIRAAIDKLSVNLAEHYVVQCYETAVNDGTDPKQALTRAVQMVLKFVPN